MVSKVDGIEVCDVDNFFQTAYRFSGRKVPMELLRDGRRLEKEVQR